MNAGKAARIAIVALLVIVFVTPVVVLLLYSVAGIWRFPSVFPETLSLRAFEYVWSQRSQLLGAIGSSILIAGATVVLTVLFTLRPASFLAKHRFPGQPLVESLLLAPALVPSITFSVGLQVIFLRLRLIDQSAGVILALSAFSYPYMLRALIAGYEVYGEEYSWCAANLGAGRLRRLLRIEIPLLIPSLVAGGTVVFLVAFTEYFIVFLIGGGAVPAITAIMFPFLNSADWQIASALILVFMFAPLALFLVVDLTVKRLYRRSGMIKEHMA